MLQIHNHNFTPLHLDTAGETRAVGSEELVHRTHVFPGDAVNHIHTVDQETVDFTIELTDQDHLAGVQILLPLAFAQMLA